MAAPRKHSTPITIVRVLIVRSAFAIRDRPFTRAFFGRRSIFLIRIRHPPSNVNRWAGRAIGVPEARLDGVTVYRDAGWTDVIAAGGGNGNWPSRDFRDPGHEYWQREGRRIDEAGPGRIGMMKVNRDGARRRDAASS